MQNPFLSKGSFLFLHSDAVHTRAAFLLAMRCCLHEQGEWWYVCYRKYICSNSLFQPFVCSTDLKIGIYYTDSAPEQPCCQLVGPRSIGCWVCTMTAHFLLSIHSSRNRTAGSLVKFFLKHYLLSFSVCMLVKDGGTFGRQLPIATQITGTWTPLLTSAMVGAQ